MVAGPEISRILEQFECSYGDVRVDTRHHEETEANQRNFLEHVRQMTNAIEEQGNPFMEDTKDLIVLDTKEIMGADVAESHKQLLNIGREQYEKFTREMYEGNSIFYYSLKRNKLPLFSGKSAPDISSSKPKLQSMKDDCQLFSCMFISCQSRQCDLRKFFMHENQTAPPSLSQNGSLNIGTKSDLMTVLESDANLPGAEPKADAYIIDGAALMNEKSPGAARTFDDYATDVVIPTLQSYSRKYNRTDKVFDIYKHGSLKALTRSKRGTGIRRKVVGASRVPGSWNNFLRLDVNKTELFEFLANHIERTDAPNRIIVTKGENVVSNMTINTEGLSPCTHEEADTRLFIHAKDAASEGCKNVIIKSTDTGVVVIGLTLFNDLNVENRWIAFGRGKSFRWVPIHEISLSLGPRARALTFFHSFTGCDTVSAFRGKGRKSAWQAWNVFEEATEVFRRLSSMPETISDDDKAIPIHGKINADEIERCHPIGKPNRKGNRQVIVKFLSYKTKARVYDARFNLRNVYMIEDLTKSNQAIASLLLKSKKAKKVLQFWSRDAKFFAKAHILQPAFRIKTESNVEDMIIDALDRGLLLENHDDTDSESEADMGEALATGLMGATHGASGMD